MHRIRDNLYISGQIEIADIPALRALGIMQIVCHRPDDESIDQPDFASIVQAAGSMDTVYVPVAGDFPPEAVAATAKALAKGVPTLMYCRSGMRSCVLWALSEAQAGRDVQDIMEDAAAIGYDLTPMIGILQTRV